VYGRVLFVRPDVPNAWLGLSDQGSTISSLAIETKVQRLTVRISRLEGPLVAKLLESPLQDEDERREDHSNVPLTTNALVRSPVVVVADDRPVICARQIKARPTLGVHELVGAARLYRDRHGVGTSE
jgi:hypothetical protein